MASTLLSWWSFNNANNDSDLLNANGDDNARSNFGHMLDNNDAFDDGFYDPASDTNGVTPQVLGEDRLYPVQDGFNGANPGELIRNTDPGVGIPDINDFGAYIDVTNLIGDNFATGTSDNWGSFGGTGLNRPTGTFGGGSLSIVGDDNNGAYFDLVADLSGFENIDVSWAQRGTSTGFDSRTVSVSTDGVNFATILTDTGTLGSSFGTAMADAGTLLDNASNAIIRFTVDGASSNGGNNRFDNIQLTGDAITTFTPSIVINEVDADTPGNDAAEFVELYDGGVGNTALDGLVVVFFNGSDDASYEAFDLDGFTTNDEGFFVLGNPGVINVDLIFNPGGSGALQNGADAVAIYQGDAADFPNDTAVTTNNLIDAIVYDTNDGDDAGLLTGLGLSTQFNEGANGNNATESNSRVPDGTGEFIAQAPTPGAANDSSGNGGGNGGELTKIYDIQGNEATFITEFGRDDASPFFGQTVTIEGIVTGDFQDGDADETRNLRGFYVQEETGDGDATTSDGIFIFENGDFLTDVNVGDKVRVSGQVTEFFGETQLTASSTVVDGMGSIAPTSISLPTVDVITNSDGELIADLEQYEGMLVTFEQTLTVDEYFNYDRFGEIRLSEGGRPFQFTQTDVPDVDGFQAHLEDLASRTITLDDGQSLQNPDLLVYPDGGFSNTNFFRGGDTVTDITGNVRFSRGSGGSGDETYRINPTETPNFISENPRPDAPEDVGGDLKVVSFNVLNYFTTIDDGSRTTANGSDPRGADDLTRFEGPAPAGTDPNAEFDRQTQKLVTTLLELDADILGLIELENDFQPSSSGNAIENLVKELNDIAGEGTYDWVNPGTQFIGTDAISNGLIYKPGSVSVVASDFLVFEESSATTTFAIADVLNPFVPSRDRVGDFQRNRPAVAATFEDTDGERLTVAVNHFKSKGDSNLEDLAQEAQAALDGGTTGFIQADIDALLADPNYDQGDGQAFWNQVRTDAANELAEWFSDTTASGYAGGAISDPDVLILGDLNAYANEAPVTALETADYTDLAEEFANEGETPYSFLFDGQLGTLDYGLANESLLSQVTGATEWHVNADEADALDYNLDFGRNSSLFNGDDPYRNSDHDPLIIGLDLDSSISGEVIEGTAGRDNLIGTDGNDTITGFQGRDNLTGGGGDDTFVYTSIVDAGDIITDFEVGGDKIDLSAVLAGVGFEGDEPISEGYLGFSPRGSDSILTLDPDGTAGSGRARSFLLVQEVTAAELNNSDNFIF